MKKINCWEFRKCKMEPGGDNAKLFGICPAAVSVNRHGANRGKNAGRACWMVAGTFCIGTSAGTFAKNLKTCMDCDFYWLVFDEEGDDFDPLP